MEVTIHSTDEQKFNAFVKKLTSFGFRVIPESERRAHQKAEGLIPPKGRKKRPGQVALIYTHLSGMTVFVWTTFNIQSKTLLDKGVASAWVLMIDENGKPKHKSRGIRRVGNFWNRLADEAIIALKRTSFNPWCSCGAVMRVTWRKDYVRGRYWRCSSPQNHKRGEVPTKRWNSGLDGKYLNLVVRRQKLRFKYNKSRREKGKDPYHAMNTRKRYTKSR